MIKKSIMEKNINPNFPNIKNKKTREKKNINSKRI